MKRLMTSQLPLDLKHAPSFASEDFLMLPCNSDAVNMLQGWPDWPSHAVALVGPKGSGKSHIGHAWCIKSDAIILKPNSDITTLNDGANIFVDNADDGDFPEDMLFHIYNWAKETSGSILFTGKNAPNRWPVQLPDLKSRLATLTVTSIGSPDEEALAMILAKLFSDRQLVIDDNILPFLVTRMERSFETAITIVEELDHLSLVRKRRLTRVLAKEVIEKLEDQL